MQINHLILFLFARFRNKKKNLLRFTGMHYHYHKLLIVLCLNLLLFNVFYIIFTASSDTNFPNRTNGTNFNENQLNWCESVGILLHFFLISSFFLMSSMSILRYLLLVDVFKNIRHFNLIFISVSYALTAIIIFSTVFSPPGPIKYVNIERKMYLILFLCFLLSNKFQFQVLALFSNRFLVCCFTNGSFMHLQPGHVHFDCLWSLSTSQ